MFSQFSSGHRGQVPPFSSFLPALTRIDHTGSVRLRHGPVHWVSKCLGEAAEQFYVPSSGTSPCPPAGVCRLGGRVLHFAGCAHLLVRGVAWCSGDANSVLNRLKRVRSVQFACLIGWATSSFSLVRGTGPSASVQFVEFS